MIMDILTKKYKSNHGKEIYGKPKIHLAKKLLKKGALWNSGIFFIKNILIKKFYEISAKNS